jgi:trimeric autotransporter adhesin
LYSLRSDLDAFVSTSTLFSTPVSYAKLTDLSGLVSTSTLASALTDYAKLSDLIDLNGRTSFIANFATSTILTVDTLGNVGIGPSFAQGYEGQSTTTPSAMLTVSGNIFADSYDSSLMPATGFTFGSTTFIAEMPPAVLTADGKGVDLYKLATYNLSGAQALAARIDAIGINIISLESRITALESGTDKTLPVQLADATSSVIEVLNSVSKFVIKVFAQFGTLIADKFVAATDSAGTSSAGTATILAGNIVAKVTNAYVLPTTKIFVTFNSQITGSWYVSDKQDGSFRVLLSEVQSSDVTFDYFLVQTEGQVATSTPSTATANSQQPTDNENLTSTTTEETATSTSSEQATTTETTQTSTSTSTPTDIIPPVVTLVGDAALQITVGDTFTDPGATATDDTDGDLTANIVVTGAVDTTTAGLYTLTYTATDVAGNSSHVSRVVSVIAVTNADSTSTLTTP